MLDGCIQSKSNGCDQYFPFDFATRFCTHDFWLMLCACDLCDGGDNRSDVQDISVWNGTQHYGMRGNQLSNISDGKQVSTNSTRQHKFPSFPLHAIQPRKALQIDGFWTIYLFIHIKRTLTFDISLPRP